MLFSSYVFIFLFLPVTAGGYALLGLLRSRTASLLWLIGCSLFFYGYWNPRYVPLIVGATAINYVVGAFWLARPNAPARKFALVLGLTFNLALLAYFKYANLLVNTFDTITGQRIQLAPIVLPLAISFFVFQKIAFLVDSYRGQHRGRGVIEFFAFVTFFPQLIAGPIVRPHEMLPQLARRSAFVITAKNFSIGLTLFIIGLAKKVLIADSVSPTATRVFDAANRNLPITLNSAWLGALCYAIQIYFDFSGYSDMAIGLARIFGFRLPVNFNSPYKAINVIDFWRRWHITLSRVLRDYLYIPLGGNRKGKIRRYVNLMITMLLGGLWHGANWTFLCWGGLHGLYLIVNHAWHAMRKKFNLPAKSEGFGQVIAITFTFLAVLFAWVFFRADNFHAAGRMLAAMVGRYGSGLDQIRENRSTWTAAILLLAASFTMPNSQQILQAARPALGVYPPTRRLGWQWRPDPLWAIGLAAVAVVTVLHLSRAAEFIYYQF
jgi:alginate O-acetyltransferase complex protein AlgI